MSRHPGRWGRSGSAPQRRELSPASAFVGQHFAHVQSQPEPQPLARHRAAHAVGHGRSRRWRVSLNGRRVMAAAVELREVASPGFYAAAA